MEWHDEGIILGARRHGETGLILEVMTRHHGRTPGIVRGGRSRRMQPLLQPGNAAMVTWRARLEDHLGAYAVEATRLRGAELMDDATSLHGLNLVLAHLRLLAEREPHEALFEAAAFLIERLDRPAVAPTLVVRFELMVLASCGFGLDLACCAATGQRDDLAYVSPKTGRAVSRKAGAPYRDRLLPLPAFLGADEEGAVSPADIGAAFRLAGYFLGRDLFAPRGIALPAARDAYLRSLARDPPSSPEAEGEPASQKSSQTRRSTTRVTP